MIEDEFDKIVRQMFEHFFGTTMPKGTEGRAVFEYRAMAVPQPTPRMDERDSAQPEAERIDLDDRVVIVVDGVEDAHRPEIRVKGGKVTLDFGGQDMVFDIPFSVDVDQSYATVRNGVLELNVVKSEERGQDDSHSDTEEEGTIGYR